MSPAPYPSWCFTLGTPPLHASWTAPAGSQPDTLTPCSAYGNHTWLPRFRSNASAPVFAYTICHFRHHHAVPWAYGSTLVATSCYLVSFWLFIPLSPMDCDFLEDGDGLILSILMVPYNPVRPSFPGQPFKNRIPAGLPVLHPDLFFSIAHVHQTYIRCTCMSCLAVLPLPLENESDIESAIIVLIPVGSPASRKLLGTR